MVITSLENDRVKKFCKLGERKYREEYDQYIVEGEHLVLEAYKSGSIVELILEEGTTPIVDAPYNYYSSEVMKKISSMETPAKVMALCKRSDSREISGEKVLILDGIQDPGNLGTIIRSAVAFNISTIILTEKTVDLYNPKVLRATQGMFFYINIIRMDGVSAITKLHEAGFRVYGTNVNNGVDAGTLGKEEKRRFALIMGNEGNGVREELLQMVDKNLYIKMNKNVESLNVGVATSILLYELGR